MEKLTVTIMPGRITGQKFEIEGYALRWKKHPIIETWPPAIWYPVYNQFGYEVKYCEMVLVARRA